FQRFPQRGTLTGRWVKTLHGGMKCEPTNSELVGLAVRFFDGCVPKPGGNGSELHQHVIIASGTSRSIVNRIGWVPFNWTACINGKDYSGHAKIAVGIRDLVDGWGAVFGFEIFGRCLIENFRHGLMALLIHLDMYVHIKR